MMNRLLGPLEFCASLFLFFLLSACTSQGDSSSQDDSPAMIPHELSLPSTSVTLTGEKVEISAVSGHQIGHGLFTATNTGKDSISIVMQKVTLRIGGEVSDLTDYHLYDLASESPLSKTGFDLGGDSEKTFYVSFPRVDAAAPSNHEIGVDLEVSVEEEVYKATSPIQIIRRIPPR